MTDPEWAVTVRATMTPGAEPQNVVELGTALVALLKSLERFGPIGRIDNAGTWYEATLVVEFADEATAWFAALDAVAAERCGAGLPGWELAVTERTFPLLPESGVGS